MRTLIVLIIGGLSVGSSYVLSGLISRNQTIISSTPTPIPVPTEAPSPSPTISAIQVKGAYTDSDPTIDCQTKSQGTVKTRRSVCLNSVDCLIGGKYYWLTPNDCNSYNQGVINQNKQPTTNLVVSQDSPVPVQDNSKYLTCMNSAQQELTNCINKCNGSYPSDGSNYLIYQGYCSLDCQRNYSVATPKCSQ